MKKYSFLVLITGLVACELTLDVNVPFEKKQLTLNCLFHPDTTLMVNLNLNRYILSDSFFQTIDNAEVVVRHQGVVVNRLSQNEYYYYSSGWKPTIGETYEIVATADGFGSVSSSSFIPAPEKISKVEMTEGPMGNHGQRDNTLRVTFIDSSPSENFYQITVSTYNEWYDYETDRIVRWGYTLPLESDDPVVQGATINEYEGVILNDILFSGRQTTISLKTPDFIFQTPADIVVTLRTVSEDYYRYKTTYGLQLDTSGDPFAQPVNVYNNIQNGFGIFAGFSQDYYHFKTDPRPEITGLTPTHGKPGDHLIITGKGFSGISPFSRPVSFKGTQSSYEDQATVVSATDTEIEVIVPDKAKTGKVILDYRGMVAVSEFDFVIVE